MRKSDCLSCIKSFVITEKSVAMQKQNKVVVNISFGADKKLVKKTFLKMFNSDVESVRILASRSKTVRRGKFIGRKSSDKRAIIKLAGSFDFDSFLNG